MVRRTLEDESIELSLSERFRPREDDDELLWKVIEITGEKHSGYKVKWEGNDPNTGKPWPQSWVAKGDVTDDLVKKWKLKKKQKEETASSKSRKSGKRSSASLATSATAGRPRSSSTRGSASTVKASTPTTSTTGSQRRSLRPIAAVDEMPQAKPPAADRGSSSRLAEVTMNTHRASVSSKSSKQSETLKRKREVSVISDAALSLPEIVAIPQDTPVARPQKKPRLIVKQKYLDTSDEEETLGVRRRPGTHKFDVESEDDLPLGESVEVEEMRPARRRMDESEEEDHEEEEAVSLFKSVKPRQQSRQAKRSKEDQNRERSNQRSLSSATPRSELRDKSRNKAKAQQVLPPDKSDHAERCVRLADTHSPKDDRSRKRIPKRLSRELSPGILKRLKRFDAEMAELEKERRKQEAETIARQQNTEEDEITVLEYYDDIPPPPKSTIPAIPHRKPSPLSRKSPTFAATSHMPQLHPTTKPRINGQSTDDSYRQGIVPETEVEDSNPNTQSLELSQSQAVSQPVLSLPSMAVEPPTSLRSRPPTPSQSTSPRKSNSRPQSPKQAVGLTNVMESEFQPPSQDADVSAPLDMDEPETQDQPPSPKKVTRNGKQVSVGSVPGINPSILPPGLSSTALKSGLDSRRRAEGDEVDGLTSSIEQFSSPEKRPRRSNKAEERRGLFQDDLLRMRGKELADTAREAKRQNKPHAAKKTLTQILAQTTHHLHRDTLKHDLQVPSMTKVLTSSTETASPMTSSASRFVPDTEHSLSDIPDEVVQEMEAAYVDLDGGANKQTEDDVVEDESSSLQQSAEVPLVTAAAILSLRQEEEESTQDLYAEAVGASGQAAKDTGQETLGTDHTEPPPPRDQDVQREPRHQAVPDKDGHESAAEVPPSASTTADTSEKLEALLQQEQQRNQSLQDELVALQKVVELSETNASSDLQELKEAYDRAKAEWETERVSLAAAAEVAAKAKAEAIKECDFFREQYARASGFVTSVRAENEELEKRAKIAEDRAASGVAMITATYQMRVKALESHVEKWQSMATFLVQKDQRTDNDELRRRAAEEPELRTRCQALEEDINVLHGELSRLVTDLSSREKLANEAVYWKQQAERFAAKLKDSSGQLERLSQAPVGSDLVYRCRWQTEADKPCGEIFSAVEDLEGHLFSAGHMQWQ